MKKYFLLIILIHKLSGATFTSFNELEKAFPNKIITNATITFDLTQQDFKGWTFINTIFYGSDSMGNTVFDNTTLQGKDSKSTIFSNSIKSGSFIKAKISNVQFYNRIENCVFDGAELENVKFIQGAPGSSFKNATLNNITFNGPHDGSFSEAKISNCTNDQGKLLKLSFGKLSLPEEKVDNK